jgi:hypothetical protein
MTKYLAGVLTVIAAGVLLIAYGLLAPGASASYRWTDPTMERAAWAAAQGQVVTMPGMAPAVAMPVSAASGAMLSYPYATVPATSYVAVPASMTVPVRDERVMQAPAASAPRARRVSTRSVERPGRDWKKTALVIGGSSAAGAGLGGIFGGKKGALIGAAIGGGACTIYERTRK